MPDRSPSLRSKLLLTRIRPGSVPASLVLLGGMLFAALVGVADWITGPNVSLVIFYVVPVVAVTWLTRVSLGVAVAAAVSLGSLLIAELDPGANSGGVWLWNAIVPFAFYLLVVWLVAGQRQLLEAHERLADIDMLTHDFFRLREQGGIPEAGINFDFDNVTFVLNVLDSLSGDQRFMEIRKRRPKHRTLTTIEKETDEASRKLAEARQRFDKEVQDGVKKEEDALAKKVDELKKKVTIEGMQD
ncbi:MAG: hypothetical protein ACXWA3_06055, partial [Acidimicrobiales bacterium]